MFSFADRVVLITGASSGIGRQLALLFAAEGARIAALDRQGEGLEKLAAVLQGKPLAIAQADVTDLPCLRSAVARLESRLGSTDLLIANAGIGMETSAMNFRAEDIAAQINVNLIGVANSIDAVLPGMRQRRQGHLAAISSLASYRGLPRMAGYCASKAGVNSLLDAIRIELQPLGIAVSTICPGWIRTALTAGIDPPPLYMMDLDVAARRIVEALRQRRAFYAFPAPDKWRVRLLRHVPLALSDWLTRKALSRLKTK